MKIAIASGKGGTGKTLVATNLFNVLLEHGYDVTLADCDAEAPNAAAFFDIAPGSRQEVYQQVPVIDPNLCTFCGKCKEYCHYNAIFILPSMNVIQVLEELCHGCGACGVACQYGAIAEKPVSLGQVNGFSLNGSDCIIEARMNIGAMSPVQVIKAAVKHVADPAGMVILDAPPGTSCPFIHTVAAADFVVLVTEPTPFGLSDLKQSAETLKSMEKPFGLIINRAGIGDTMVQKYLVQERIPLLLEIPFSHEIARIYSAGGMVVNEFPELGKELLDMVNKIARKWR